MPFFFCFPLHLPSLLCSLYLYSLLWQPQHRFLIILLESEPTDSLQEWPSSPFQPSMNFSQSTHSFPLVGATFIQPALVSITTHRWWKGSISRNHKWEFWGQPRENTILKSKPADNLEIPVSRLWWRTTKTAPHKFLEGPIEGSPHEPKTIQLNKFSPHTSEVPGVRSKVSAFSELPL